MELANGKVNKFFTLPDKGENRYYIDDFDADEDKYNNNVYLLSEYIPEKSVVLDIGCGSGKFGQKLKEKNCTVYGLERDSKAAECARRTDCYQNVFECDITEKNSSAYKEFLETAKDIDIIILSDILEHLEEPTQLLLECNSLLKENGYILVSVPNVAHMDISLNLLNGKFNYTDMGILDNTHLKFFTKTSFFEWISLMNESFTEINFGVEYLGGTFYNNEFLDEVKHKYKELYEVLQCSETYNTMQLLFKISKLSKGQLPSKMKDLLTDKANNIVDILGKRLKGEVPEAANVPSLLKGERIEYEQQVESLNESVHKQQAYISNLESDIEKKQAYISNLESGMEKQQQYINNLNSNIDEQKKYIEVVDKSLEWYRDNDLSKSNLIKNQVNYEKTLEESINWYKENVEAKGGQIKEQLNYIRELKESIKWYEEYTKSTNNEKDEREKYIKTLEESIKWYELNKEDMHMQIEAKEEAIEQIRLEKEEEVTRLAKENSLLSKKLIQLEKSICFKIYKFFNKN